MEGYTGSVATNTALSVDTVATNKHFQEYISANVMEKISPKPLFGSWRMKLLCWIVKYSTLSVAAFLLR